MFWFAYFFLWTFIFAVLFIYHMSLSVWRGVEGDSAGEDHSFYNAGKCLAGFAFSMIMLYLIS